MFNNEGKVWFYCEPKDGKKKPSKTIVKGSDVTKVEYSSISELREDLRKDLNVEIPDNLLKD